MNANVREETNMPLYAVCDNNNIVFGPSNALLLAARELVAAGYRFEQINYALAVAMECLQEEPRDENER